MKELTKWLHILRPGTLFASYCPVSIGLLVAAKTHNIHWTTAFITHICALGLQILSNLVNDYYDFKKGLDKEGRIGFKRALAEGSVSVAQIKAAIGIVLFIILATGVYLTLKGGIIILLIGLFSMLFAWLYTATEKSLSYTGVADIFVFVFFGPVAVIGTTYLQSHVFIPESIYAGFVCGAISTCVLIVNNIRDRETDVLAEKKSFVVRFGKKAGETEYLFFILTAGVFSFVANPFTFSNLIILPGVFLFTKLLKTTGSDYNEMLIKTGLLNVLFFLLFFIDFFIDL